MSTFRRSSPSRAERLQNHAALGVDASGLDTLSYGEQRPVDPGHDELSWAINRRVHFLVRRR